MGSIHPDIPRSIEAAADNMPAISPIIGKINHMAREMETSPRELVKVIMLDPVLTGKVLKLVNSSFYGLVQRVQSLTQAVVLLGLNTVKNLTLSTALLSTVFIKGKKSPLFPEDFWRHCLATAVGCKMLAEMLRENAEDLEKYFIAGLLHDVGKILLIRADPNRYARALSESRRLGVSLTFAELAQFGCTHAQAGGLLARRWHLDEYLVDIIALHHAVPQSSAPLLRQLVTIANNLCKAASVGESGNTVVEEMATDITGQLLLSSDNLDHISQRLPPELERASDFLTIIQEH